MHLILRFAGAMLVVVCVTLSPDVAAQQGGFFVYKAPPSKANYSGVSVWVADCAKLDVKSLKPQTLQCTLTQDTCEPCLYSDPKQCQGQKVCPFVVHSTDQPPTAVIFGLSSHNPTCYWVWDPWGYRYVYRCW